jgi:hypothetical protein
MFTLLKVSLGQSVVQQTSILRAQVRQVSAHSIHAIIVADNTLTTVILGSIGRERQRLIAPVAMTQVLDIYVLNMHPE